MTAAEDVNADISEMHVTHTGEGAAPAVAELDPKKVRPIQIGKFLRRYVSRRLLAFSEGEIAVLMTGRSDWLARRS